MVYPNALAQLKDTCQIDCHLLWQSLQFAGTMIPEAVIALDSENRVQVFNSAAEELMRRTQSEVLGKDAGILMDRGQARECLLQKALNTGETFSECELKWVYEDGTVQELLADVLPLCDSEGKIRGVIGRYKDIKKIQAQESRIQQLEAQAAIGQMAAGTVHEIRNSLTSIKGFSQLGQSRAIRQSDDNMAEYCDLIIEEVNHINSVVTDFLSMAKPNEKLPVAVDVLKLVGDVLNFMYGESLLSGITIVHRLPREKLFIKGTPDKLKELLINLCRNGFQSMSAGGTLRVEVRADHQFVSISVKDNGIGMGPDTLQKIFQPFFTTKETGTGLGLVICQRIAREHEGEILVDSTEGKGTTFTVRLPRKTIMLANYSEEDSGKKKQKDH